MSVLSTSELEQAVPAQSTEGPGAQLRKKRLSLSLDRSRVAAQLHLSESTIDALEMDDFDALPGAVFVQGYLRNYARLLGASEAEMIRAYQALCPEPDYGCLSTSSSITHEVRSSHSLVQLMTWLIVIGLGMLLVFWWQGRGDLELPPLAELEPDEVVTELSATDLSSPFGSVPSLIPSVPIEEEAEVVELAEIIEYEEQAEETPAETISLETPAVEPVPEIEPVAATPLVLARTVELQETVPLLEMIAPDEDRPPQVIPDQLIFEFRGRCWAEVRDTTGKARIIGEMRDGSRRTLNASLGPFKIVLGDASVVQLTVAGGAYDLTPHTRGRVARFTLDPATL